MLRELENVRQVSGEPARRWFSDEIFDLVVFSDEIGNLISFQLIYDKMGLGRALSWDKTTGYSHHRMDDGEDRPGKPKSTPILLADGLFNKQVIARDFAEISASIDAGVARFVLEKITAYT
jgi:hypothetical protein